MDYRHIDRAIKNRCCAPVCTSHDSRSITQVNTLIEPSSHELTHTVCRHFHLQAAPPCCRPTAPVMLQHATPVHRKGCQRKRYSALNALCIVTDRWKQYCLHTVGETDGARYNVEQTGDRKVALYSHSDCPVNTNAAVCNCLMITQLASHDTCTF